MNNIINSKRQTTQWLFEIIMLFSIFTFAGFSGEIKPDFRQTVKTEMTITKNFKAVKRAISYKNVHRLCSYHSPIISLGQKFTSLIYVHTRLVKVKLDQLSIQKHYFNNHFHYFQINAPQDSDDDTSVILIG